MAIDMTLLQSEQTLIPFLFVLAIIFGVLEVTNVLRNRGANLLVAIAIAFFSVSNSAFVALLWSQFGFITAFFIIMFFIVFILEVFGLRNPKYGKPEGEGMFINGAILLLLLIFGFMHASSIPNLPFVGSGTNLIALITLIFILVIFFFNHNFYAKQQIKKFINLFFSHLIIL